MLTGEQRREEIINSIMASEGPMSGKALATKYDVSRQVIVQDIALIRASGVDVISTNRGYFINNEKTFSRVLKVKHTDDEVEEELFTIIDLGGKVKNVMINHKVYGHIEAELNINSRRKANEFIEDIVSGKSSPLKNITSDYHYHTIEADSEETLDLIESKLKEKGFLVMA